MSIAPIVRSVTVKAPPAKAFDLFANHIGQWWPHGKGVGKEPCVDVVIEPHDGGRLYERDANGVETQWGKVLRWDPPSRLLLGWQLNSKWTFDPDFLTEVELTFEPADDGGTIVTLEHRDLERFGADAAKQAEQLGSGWPARLANFAEFTSSHR